MVAILSSLVSRRISANRIRSLGLRERKAETAIEHPGTARCSVAEEVTRSRRRGSSRGVAASSGSAATCCAIPVRRTLNRAFADKCHRL